MDTPVNQDMVTIEECNVDGRYYRVCGGTFYAHETDSDMIYLLEHLRRLGKRYAFWYGDTITGQGWGDVVIGYLGRSTGRVKVPILLYNKAKAGGYPLLDANIVKVVRTKGKAVVYEHPRFKEQPRI